MIFRNGPSERTHSERSHSERTHSERTHSERIIDFLGKEQILRERILREHILRTQLQLRSENAFYNIEGATTKAQKHHRALQGHRTKAYGTGYEIVRAW